MHTTARRIARLIALALAAALQACAPTGLVYKIDPEYGVDDPQFTRTVGSLLGPSILPGNSVTTYVNGDQIFPAMLDGIAHAEKTITFETFVYWSGDVGRAFSDALAERARAGVRVSVLIDAIGGAWLDQSYIKNLRDSGAQVVFYHALRWYDLSAAKRFNHRTHRKILVIDGKVGFTGGVGIADEWAGDAQDPKHYRDNHYRVEGPVVAQIQAAFMDTWMDETGQVLHDAGYFPKLEPADHLPAQYFMSSYKGGSENMHLMFLLSFAAARKNIRLSTAYFVPDDLTIKTLVEALNRGVQVQIIAPGPEMDRQFVRGASRARWGPLLKAGAQIFEYQPTMYHCKLMIVDDLWTSIGSANLDNRSFVLNDEANLNILDPAFAAQQAQIFDNDLKHCRQITYQEWQNRPAHEKIAENLANTFWPQF